MTDPSVSLKRVKRKKKKSENPLFEKWLKEWKEEAEKNGSDFQYCLNKALKSLRKFPVKLRSGKECVVLENFGAKICKMLDDKLDRYKALHPEGSSGFPETCNQGKSNSLNIVNNSKIIQSPEKNFNDKKSCENKKIDTTSDFHLDKCKNSHYVPAYRSGPYAILVTLLEKAQENGFKGFMSKAELQTEAQNLCDSSFTKAVPGSYYTAWSSMGILLKKNLVSKHGKPSKFSLTAEGTDLAINLKQLGISNDTQMRVKNSVSPSKDFPLQTPKKVEIANPKPLSRIAENTSEQPMEKSEETFFLLPGSFEVILLVDTQERDNKYQQSNNMTMSQLKSRNVNFEIRHLKVGDFIWIAKDSHSGNELVLPYVAERKRMDDLASSIKDGRFHEQKFRLKQCGVENLIYLVEKYGNENQRLGLPLPTLLQAISNTQVLNGFTVKVTNNHEDSMRYLDCMTSQLNKIFQLVSSGLDGSKMVVLGTEDMEREETLKDAELKTLLNKDASQTQEELPESLGTKTLMSCKKTNLTRVDLSDDLIPLMTFTEFNKGSEKNKKPTVRNMLLKHLLQLNGVSVEKSSAIVHLFPTPGALMEALKHPHGDSAIADLTFGRFNRPIGSATAKQIQMLYTSMELR